MFPFPKAKLGGAVALIGALLLAACMFTPGKFDAALDIRRDGHFSFSYIGEMHFLALSQLAKAGEKSASFTPEPCTDEDSGEEKPCSAAQLTEQRETWERERSDKAQREKREAQSMKVLMGDLDMSDPKSGEELASRLRRQAGWRRVDYRGDGLFDVEFQLSGTLDHDFAFPTIEQFPMANAFVQLTRRSDGSVRIDSPGFGPAAGAGLLSGLAASSGASPGSDMADMPTPDGRFALTTDAPLLANNTDEGPREVPGGKQLEWAVNSHTKAAPMALVRLAPPVR
jgi:hypothetical protein